MEKIEIAMTELKYNKKWIEYKLINKKYVCKEYEKFIKSADKNTEHYRYNSFKKLLKEESFFTDEKIKYYVELAKIDENQVMGISAIIELICCKHLTNEQFANLWNYLPKDNPVLYKVYNRERLLRCLLNTTDLTQEVFSLMLSTDDSVIHLALINRNDLSYNQLFLLFTLGKTKTIRNLAKVSLRRFCKINSCL